MTMSCSDPPAPPPLPCRLDGLVAVSAALDGARFSRPIPLPGPEPEPEDDEPLGAHA